MSGITCIGIVREGKIELTNSVTLPEGSQVSIQVSVLIDEKIARRKANRWLIEQVGNMVIADKVMLIQADNHTIWRFEAMVTASTHPPVGPIGHVEVDATTGNTLSNNQIAEAMIERGQHLTSTSLPAKG